MDASTLHLEVFMSDKLAQVRARFDEWKVDGVLITGAANRRWLSGFTGSSGSILLTRERAIFSTDSRYWEQAARQAPAFELYRHTEAKDSAQNFLEMGKGQRIGIEAQHMSVAQYQAVQGVESVAWVPLPETVEPLRAVKSADELALIRRAAAITDQTVAQAPRFLQPGVSESAAAWELEKFMREAGADGVGFEIIVASGPNSALPHHRPGERVLQAGDIVVVDLGAEFGGYKSDLTRTFYLGESAPDAFWDLYHTVHAAQAAAIGGIRAGVTGQSVDSLARDLITGAGHGKHFGHGTGHGVGLNIHEEPRFSRVAEKTIIPAGAVMTVEPGIYLPGYGGVRIEDLMLVTADGSEYLSHAPKDPRVSLRKPGDDADKVHIHDNFDAERPRTSR
jgi:Xaa-Pro aminopeptidase